VLIKSVKTLTAILVALAAYGVSAVPANAKPMTTKQDVLVSQLSGHDLYNKGSQLVMSDYAIGRVRGAVGSILQIELLKYGEFPGYMQIGDTKFTHLNMPGNAQPGDDVIIRYVSGSKRLELGGASLAHPAWISRLNLKEVSSYEKTAVEFESSAPVSLPPVQPSAPPAYQPAPTPAPAPVRGMW
jgi:hypothetical protein